MIESAPDASTRPQISGEILPKLKPPNPPNCGAGSASASRPQFGRAGDVGRLGLKSLLATPGNPVLAHGGGGIPSQFVTVFSTTAVMVRVLPLPCSRMEEEVVVGRTDVVALVTGLPLVVVEVRVVVVVIRLEVRLTVIVLVVVRVMVGTGTGYLFEQYDKAG